MSNVRDYTLNRGIGGHHPVSHRGRTDEWLTPPPILNAMGEFDLDPCAPIDRPWDTAKHHFTITDDGLHQPWFGRVWMNPPYGNELSKWLCKLSQHGNGIAFTFARTETDAFHRHVWQRADGILFLRGRVSFYDVKGNRSQQNAGGPSCLIGYGAENAACLRECGIDGKYLEISR